jgi:uncharacterized protein (TIGR03067 family)
MRKRELISVAFLAILTFGSTAAKANQDSSDQKPSDTRDTVDINGSWRLVSVEVPGTVVRPDKGEEITYVFKDGKLSVKRSENNDVQTSESSYQLDAKKDPKTIDMTMTIFITATVNGQRESSKQEKKVHGIYNIEGDKLRLCLTYENQDRPTKFVPPAKATGFLILCERQKDGKPAAGNK